MTDGRVEAASRALLVHSENALWRRAMRDVLRPLLRASGVTVLVSSREAEAAKCLADARVVLVLAIDEPAIRRTLKTLAPTLPVIWTAGNDGGDDVAARVRVALDALSHPAQRGSSA